MPEGDTGARPGGPGLRGAVVELHRLQRPLPAVPTSARIARLTVRVACRAWRVPEAGEAAALLASELVTTALHHLPRGQLLLTLRMTPRRLRLEVHEPTGVLPDQLDPDDDEQRSLQVVQGCSVRWGVEDARSGRQLFAELALPLAEEGAADTRPGAVVTGGTT